MKGSGVNVVAVDLATGHTHRVPVSAEERQRYLGGFALNVFLASHFIRPGVEPLSATNPIIIGSTPLAGTPAPGTARLSVITKLPLNHAIASCNGSMGFSCYLRASGIDHLVITGMAPGPCYLLISRAGVEVRQADDLWGLDTYEATEVLAQRHAPLVSIIATGPLGERQSPIALAFVDKAGTVGKGGLGAVMGSKKLKAIVALGDEPVEVEDVRSLRTSLREIFAEMQNDPQRSTLLDLGTMAGWDKRGAVGFPYLNWTRLFSKQQATELYGPTAYRSQVKLKRGACLGCTLPDKEILRVPSALTKGTGGCRGFTYASSFSGRAVNYGIRCGVGDAAHVASAHDAANRYGICDHHWSAAVDLARDLRDRGLLAAGCDGLHFLDRGYDTTMELMRMTVEGRGIGALLAMGIPGIIRELGDDAKDRAIAVQGMDMVFDPRSEGLGTKELAQIVSPRRHWVSGFINPYTSGMSPDQLARSGATIGMPIDAVDRILPHEAAFRVGRLLPHVESWYALLSSVGICTRSVSRYYNPSRVASVLSASTGVNYSQEELLQVGRRAWDLLRSLNARDGLSAAQDEFPARWLREPILTDTGEELYLHGLGPGKNRLDTGDVASTLSDYYQESGWDPETGIPMDDSEKADEKRGHT